MNRKKQKLSLRKDEVEKKCQEEEMTVLRQKIMSMEDELKLKSEAKDHLEKRVSSLEQELARKETQLKLKDEEQERLVERVASLEQELALKENQLKIIKEPFDALPNEVMLEIFKHLTQNELGKIAGVCQRWNELTKSPVLWQNVSVEFYISHNDAIISFINRLPYSPTSITVQFPYFNDWIQPLDFQEFCVALQRKCPQLKQLVLEKSDFTNSLSSIVELCTQFLPNMTSLALPLAEFCNCPTTVQCSDTSKITILDVCGLSRINHLSKPLFLRMPDLKVLYLSCSDINDSWFSKMISLPNHIEILHLRCTDISYTSFRVIKKYGQNLKELCMCRTELDDDVLNFDTSALPQLKIFCLGYCETVTCEGVVSLVQSCPSLQNIYVDDEVAVSYARHSYVIANPGKLGIVKNISCRKHIKKYY